jgi:hypothetical protein
MVMSKDSLCGPLTGAASEHCANRHWGKFAALF